VFLSHAGEDTDRFVKPFARALRAKAVDVWVDFWEIRDGDSLVSKIFEEGIGQAEAVLIVVSKYSVHKPWVEKELNVSVIRQIEKGIRLIPIVLDDQEVPVALQDTKYRKIPDPEHFEPQLDELVMSLHGYTDKPPLGEPPPYALERINITGLAPVDARILQIAGDLAVETDRNQLDSREIFRRAAEVEIAEEQAIDALEILLERRHLVENRVMAGGRRVFSNLRFTMYGLSRYLEYFYPGHEELRTNVVARIVNDGLTESRDIARAGGAPGMLVEHMLNVLRAEGLIDTREFAYGQFVTRISPQLRRL